MKQIFKAVLVTLLLSSSLLASLKTKSAIVYYGKDISYPMVGIHNYIIVDPEKINVYRHGFNVYKDKIYATILLDREDIDNIEEKIESYIKQGYKNFFLKIEDGTIKDQVVALVNYIDRKHPSSKIIINVKYAPIDEINTEIDALYTEGLDGIELQKLQTYGLDIIDIEFKGSNDIDDSKKLVKKLQDKGVIPYITNRQFTRYGKSSKNAIKREILTLIDESKVDRMLLSAHQHGALVLEYLGYIEKLYDINHGLPSLESMDHYAGVIVWLPGTYENPDKLIEWVRAVIKKGIKVSFVNNFGAQVDHLLLKQLGITVFDSNTSYKNKRKIIQRESMVGFETEPNLSANDLYFAPENAEPIYTVEDQEHMRSVPAAITQWGGYILPEAFLIEFGEENIWAVNPFEYFTKTLRLKPLLVPDTTTENGNRLLFTHIDGDGIMNGVESNGNLYSGDMILNKILKRYKIPHSVSVIGAEIDDDGLYPKLAKRLQSIAKQFYALDNVEAATHTFTHPFKWGKIDKNGFLPLKYRLKVKNYDFSIQREIKGSIDEINKNYVTNEKDRAKTVYWSGDCMPRVNALELAYKNKILNINGGYTTIRNSAPWLTLVAPIGLQRGGYYQIYTGAQNENVYTNDWLGPFWGFKKVVQTFKLTNSPRRLKPIDIYYHLYSGSKTASLNALKYVFDWAIKQDVMPIYTSSYIPKAMDYFTVSMAKENSKWLVCGMKDLKTLRLEKKNASIVFKKSKTAVGVKHFENHTYISLDNNSEHYIKTTTKESYKTNSYLVSANAKVAEFHKSKKNQKIVFDGEVPLKLEFHLTNECRIEAKPQADLEKHKDKNIFLEYKKAKKATIMFYCK